MTREITTIILIDMVKRGLQIKLSWTNACDKQNSLLKDQLTALQAK